MLRVFVSYLIDSTEKNVHTYGEVETEDADERERTNSAGENVKNTAQRLLSGGATVEIDKCKYL